MRVSWPKRIGHGHGHWRGLWWAFFLVLGCGSEAALFFFFFFSCGKGVFLLCYQALLLLRATGYQRVFKVDVRE